jgi:hypothetical protein
LVEASLTVFIVSSADVPPITIARWYGGHAAVPSVSTFSLRNATMRSCVRIDGVAWNRNALLAEPPPLAMNRNL